MAEVLARYSNLGRAMARLAKAEGAARQHRRPEPWVAPDVTVKALRRLTDDEVAAMVADYRAGMGSFVLAKKYGVSDTTVLARLKAAGVEVVPASERQAQARATTDEMRRLHEDEGWTMTDIGAHFGVTRQAVGQRLRRGAT